MDRKIVWHFLKDLGLPVPGIPNLNKLFIWFAAKKQGISPSVLTLKSSSLSKKWWMVNHSYKQLDPMAAGWPAGLRAAVATVLLVEQCFQTPHHTQGVLGNKEFQWWFK